MERHEWIVDVLIDLKTYALKQKLGLVSKDLETTINSIKTALTIGDDVGKGEFKPKEQNSGVPGSP